MSNNNYRYQTFVAVSGNLGGKVPILGNVLSSHEQEIYRTTSLDENCIEFEFQTARNYYVDLRQSFLALKLKFVKGRGYDTYESKEKKKEHKGESVVFTETGTTDDEEEDVARVTYVNNIMQSIFSNVEVYINNQQIYNSNGLYAHKSYISNNFKAAISEYKGVLHCEGYDYEQDPEDITNPLPDPFFTRRMKLLSRPDDFMLYGKLGIDFFSTSELLYPNMKIRLPLIRAGPNFYMISDNPNVSLGIVDCSLYTRRLALKDDYHKQENGHARLCSCRIQLFGDFGKDIHHTCGRKPVDSRKHFQKCSHSSSRDCNEHKFCLYWFFYRKPILVSTI